MMLTIMIAIIMMMKMKGADAEGKKRIKLDFAQFYTQTVPLMPLWKLVSSLKC